MVIVNAAAMQVVSEISDDVRVYQAVVRYRSGAEQAPSELLGNLSKLLEADKIVFWGDWLHMRTYIASLVDASKKNRSKQSPGLLVP